jgi:signal transduction histidine kinase
VLGLTQSLLAQELPPAVRDDLTLVHESGAGLVSLINDLLDLSRAESGALEVHAAPVDLHRLVREVGGIHKATALHKHLTLEVLGAPEAPCWVSTDAARLRQVVGNLVSNAVKFTERGGVTIALSIEPLDAATLTATIAVTDTGRGLSERDLGQLFKPFVQLHADKAHEGTGLGLVISRELATRLGGALTVQSVEGSGSTFTLTLRLPGAVAPWWRLIRATGVSWRLSPSLVSIPTCSSMVSIRSIGASSTTRPTGP